jgi:hypothetical protein
MLLDLSDLAPVYCGVCHRLLGERRKSDDTPAPEGCVYCRDTNVAVSQEVKDTLLKYLAEAMSKDNWSVEVTNEIVEVTDHDGLYVECNYSGCQRIVILLRRSE